MAKKASGAKKSPKTTPAKKPTSAKKSAAPARPQAKNPAKAAAKTPAKTPPKAPPKASPTAPVKAPAPAPAPTPPVEPVVSGSFPERAFAARAPAPEPERPKPTHRRVIFFDVENTSRESVVTSMLEHLALDRSAYSTELIASGNWRVIGNETARLLARAGAHLVHSAPATGVRDWSDLRIAVAAGVWLATARVGDELDVVSDDKAFDVVGDVAAVMGVRFRRISYRALPGAAPTRAAPARAASGAAAPGKAAPAKRGRRRGGASKAIPAKGAAPVPVHAPAPPREAPAAAQPRPPRPPRQPRPPRESPVAAPPPSPKVEGAEPHAAPPDDLLEVVQALLLASPNGVRLEVVERRLKERGFERPPNSPRLVTRLRRFHVLEVSPTGLVRMRNVETPAE